MTAPLPPNTPLYPGQMIQVSTPTPVTKSGWKTSEFWISLIGVIGMTAQAMSPNNSGVSMIGTGLAAGAYALGRSYVKANS